MSSNWRKIAQNGLFFENFVKKMLFPLHRNRFSLFSLIRMPLGAKTTINSHGGVEKGPKSLKIGIFFDNFVQKIVGRKWFVGGPHGGLTLEITWSEFS